MPNPDSLAVVHFHVEGDKSLLLYQSVAKFRRIELGRSWFLLYAHTLPFHPIRFRSLCDAGGRHSSFGCSSLIASLTSPSMCFSSPLKTKFCSPKICWRPRFIQVDEENLRLGLGRARRSVPDGAGGQGENASRTVAPSGRNTTRSTSYTSVSPARNSRWNRAEAILASTTFSLKVVGLADQDAARLRQAFQNQTGRA